MDTLNTHLNTMTRFTAAACAKREHKWVALATDKRVLPAWPNICKRRQVLG